MVEESLFKEAMSVNIEMIRKRQPDGHLREESPSKVKSRYNKDLR